MKLLEQLDDSPDVWNLHWVSWFLEWEKMLPELAKTAPIVWTLHDLNPLRGIWHYEPGSQEASQLDDLEQRAIRFKRKALQQVPSDRLVFVGPSRWIAQQCRNSPVTAGFPVVNIPYGVDSVAFAPRDKLHLRKICDIPEDSHVVGFVADDLSDPRKGVRELIQTLKRLGTTGRIHLLSVGRGAEAIDIEGIPHTHLGVLSSDLLLSHFYSACDLFACPSLQDNLPNTVLESMACGTPVVGFNVGGMPDMVRPSISGVLCELGNIDALSHAIESLIGNTDTLAELSKNSRALVEQDYTLEIQAERYVELYLSLIAGSKFG
jgi:glycosyltransferase involved in cell wall biosynthesis